VTASARRHPARPSLLIASLILATFVTAVTSTSIVAVLPAVSASFQITQPQSAWLVTTAVLAATASLGAWSAMARGTDGRIVLLIALSLFVVTAVAIPFADDWATTLVLRALQGMSIGGVHVTTQVVIAAAMSPRERSRYLGHFAVAAALSTISGPSIGGLITETLGWQYVFLIPAPFGVLAVIGLLALPRSPLLRPQSAPLMSALLLAIVSTGALLSLEWAGGGLDGLAGIVAAVAAVLALVPLLLLQHRGGWPVLAYRREGGRGIGLLGLASLTSGAVFLGALVLLSQYFQISQRQSAFDAGISLVPMVAGTVLAATLIGAIATRTGRWKESVLASAALTLVGVVALGLTLPQGGWLVYLGMTLLGIGVGGMSPQTHLLIAHHLGGAEHVGFSSALIAFTRNLGSAVGVATGAIVVGVLLTSWGIDQLTPSPESFAAASSITFLCMSPIAAIALACVALLPGSRLRDE